MLDHRKFSDIIKHRTDQFMKSFLYHLQINVSNAKVSIPFYVDLFTYLEYKIIGPWEDGMGAKNDSTDFWIFETKSKYKENVFHRKATGLNHLAFKVESKENVDKFCKEFLIPHNITPLYDSPKIFAEYREDYYAVYFEDPDKIKLEVLYFASPND